MVKHTYGIYRCVVMSFHIEPTNRHQVQLRRDYLLKAKSAIYSLISQIEAAHEIFGLEPKVMKSWMELVDNEIKFIQRALIADETHYKNIK